MGWVLALLFNSGLALPGSVSGRSCVSVDGEGPRVRVQLALYVTCLCKASFMMSSSC